MKKEDYSHLLATKNGKKYFFRNTFKTKKRAERSVASIKGHGSDAFWKKIKGYYVVYKRL
jgi:hypothetical protein